MRLRSLGGCRSLGALDFGFNVFAIVVVAVFGRVHGRCVVVAAAAAAVVWLSGLEHEFIGGFWAFEVTVMPETFVLACSVLTLECTTEQPCSPSLLKFEVGGSGYKEFQRLQFWVHRFGF